MYYTICNKLLILNCLRIVIAKNGLMQYDYNIYDELMSQNTTFSVPPTNMPATNSFIPEILTTLPAVPTFPLPTIPIQDFDFDATSNTPSALTDFPSAPFEYTTPYTYPITYPTTLTIDIVTTTNDTNSTTPSTHEAASTQMEEANSTTVPMNSTSEESVISIKKEIESRRENSLDGYFTASFHVLLDILMKKDPVHLKELFNGFATETIRKHRDLQVLGTIPRTGLQLISNNIARADQNIYHIQIDFTRTLLENRTLYLDVDKNDVIDALDAIYCMRVDVNDIARVLDDVKQYPANKSGFAISDDAIQTLIVEPYNSIQDKILNDTLSQKLTSILFTMYQPGIIDRNLFGRRRAGYHGRPTRIIKHGTRQKSMYVTRPFVFSNNRSWRDNIRRIREYKANVNKYKK